MSNKYSGSITLASVSDGRGITSTDIKYAASTSGTVWPESESDWFSEIPVLQNNQYLWTRTTITYTDGSQTNSYSVSKDGKDGTSGRGIDYTEIKYAVSDSGANPPPADASEWQATVPEVLQGQFLWTRTIITYTDKTSTTTYSVSSFGKDGTGIVYFADANHEKLYKFDTSTGLSFSPETIVFNLSRNYGNERQKIGTNDYDTKLYLVGHSNDDDVGEIWTLLKSLKGKRSGESTQESLIDVIRITTESDIEFKFVLLLTYEVEGITGNTSSDIAKFNNLKQIIYEENLYFNIEFFDTKVDPDNGLQIASKAIPLEFGTSQEMAKFAITANAIQAAVNESKLTFDATNGLTIRNGGLRILDRGDVPLLQYNNGSLQIVGSGSFTGAINATSGSFTGSINANSGDIGGFILSNDGLYSEYGAVKNGDNWDTTGSSIKLNGRTGEINANNINLGTGANIENFIKLGMPLYIIQN